MKTSITHISISQPCHEQWDNMHDVEGGRFCDSCKKTVTDFSKLSNNEIIAFLSSRNKVCGRFDERQLISLNQHLQQQQPALISKSVILKVAATIIAAFSITNVKAQTKLKSVNRQHKTVQKTRPDFEPLVNSQLTSRKITGKVVDVEGKPLSGVRVTLLYDENGVLTDKNGNFSIETSLFSAANAIVVSAAGFVTQNVLANSDKLDQELVLVEEYKVMRFVVGGASVITRASLVKRIWRGITNPFRAIF